MLLIDLNVEQCHRFYIRNAVHHLHDGYFVKNLSRFLGNPVKVISWYYNYDPQDSNELRPIGIDICYSNSKHLVEPYSYVTCYFRTYMDSILQCF